MANLKDFRLLSFDVYGTLIDYETGILSALEPLLRANNRTDISRLRILETYHELEVEQQRETPGMPYSELLATIHKGLADKLGLAPPTAEESRAFGSSTASWPAFPDTVAALRRLATRYKLVVLSNVDRVSFGLTNAGPLQGFPFDLVITAQDIGSYKPDPRNFEHMLKEVKEKFDVDKEQVLQTAQSQFHDHHPARAMGIKSVWIVRPGAIMGNREQEIYDWKFNTLGDMADALDAELSAP
ncbi:HAD-like protein [Annulohypoxylon truncatum]|uniref:HAD-like protein n=1 Tax=Annulohypoxylon truncatum TaxID=327061 RepID=UPI002007B344|nr:HAD-like protein [Annulohypoxylon truncatum]KAI1212101.1 HAD-like protein [Annulohypoxylon truncatum]